jgi:hypothetical protein
MNKQLLFKKTYTIFKKTNIRIVRLIFIYLNLLL